jgi:hypothetical protein
LYKKIDLQKRNALKNGVLFLVSSFILARTATHQQKAPKAPKKRASGGYIARNESAHISNFKIQITNYQAHLLSHSLRPSTPAPPLPRNTTFASPSLSLSRLQIPASIIHFSHVMSFSSHLLSFFCILLRSPFSFTSGVFWI